MTATVQRTGSAGQMAFSVSELTAYIKRLIDRDEVLAQVSVRGEISNFTRHRSGHLYFALKDEASQLACVCFRGDATRLGFEPADGQRVIAHGNVTVYEPRGAYQLVVRALVPDGEGALAEAIARLRARLAAEGLFEPARKRPLPRFPRRIALVTSPDGAAVRDLVSVISRRYPPAELIVVPATVQGEEAPASLVRALELATSVCDADLVIVARGGGSLEDLWAFFDERVVRAIFACPVPVISAVGHETDVCLCDEVADLRAPTPSAAGELAVPDVVELMAHLEGLQRRALAVVERRLGVGAARLVAIEGRPALARPLSLLEARWQRIDEAGARSAHAVALAAERLRHRLSRSALTLRALDPRVGRRLSVIDRRRARIADAARRAQAAVERRLGRWSARLERAEVRPAWLRSTVAARRSEPERATARLRASVERGLERRRGRLDAADASLRALSPLAVVERGYALVWRDRDHELVRSVRAVAPREGIYVSVADGEIAARVTATRSETRDDD